MKFSTLVIICLSLSILSFAQKTKSQFKIIKYATYHWIDGKPQVEFYTDIDQSGVMKAYQKFDEVVTTSTLVLNDDRIKTLNSIFNGTKKLRSSLIKTKLEDGLHYAGAYHFLVYRDSNGVSDSLTFIPPFMSESFNEKFRKFEEILYGKKQPSKTELNIDGRFLKSLTENHKKANYLPVFEAPPPGQP